MAAMTRRTYKHSHNCSLEGEEITFTANASQGVEYVIAPICVEANVELELVSREVI